MVISKENKDFINSLIDYYISESESYIQIAENFVPEVEFYSRYSIMELSQGVCITSGFLQALIRNQQLLISVQSVLKAVCRRHIKPQTQDRQRLPVQVRVQKGHTDTGDKTRVHLEADTGTKWTCRIISWDAQKRIHLAA